MADFCIHGGYPKLCKRCVSKIEGLLTQSEKISASLEDVIDAFVEFHNGSYHKTGTFYNIHLRKTQLVNSLTKFIIEYDNQNPSSRKSPDPFQSGDKTSPAQ